MMTRDPARVKRTAKLAGGLYFALVPFSVYALMYVPSKLVVSGDAAATAQKIMASPWLLRSGTVSHLLAEIALLFVALALYEVFRPVNRIQAQLMVALVLLGAAIGTASEVDRLAALQVLSGGDALQPLVPEQLYAEATLSLEAWHSGLLLTQVFWGLWLFPLGYLVLQSGAMPRLLGILVIIAGGGYVVDAVLGILWPTIGVTVSPFTFVGELLFLLWLLFKGVNAGRCVEATRAPATTGG